MHWLSRWNQTLSAAPWLAASGWFNVGLLVIAVFLLPLDDRLVSGVNPWFKPVKFAASVAIFCWTVAWLLRYIDGMTAVCRLIERGIAVVMVIEQAAIFGQAGRGLTSHYNVATPLDGAIFGAMGLAIIANTLFLTLLLGLYLVRAKPLPAAVVWGIRLGLAGSIGGSMEGFAMILNQAHTVGAADGGAGLPFLNWSTQHGDYRVAHALGLHMLQAFPVAGWLFQRFVPSRAAQLGLLAVFVALYVALAWWQFQLARGGRPFFG
jgi:hypothetical protein